MRFKPISILVRCPPFNELNTAKTPIYRRKKTSPEIITAVRTTDTLGMGICIPRATKNNVIKKSRIFMTFAIISKLYGNVAKVTPAINAPISIDKPTAG